MKLQTGAAAVAIAGAATLLPTSVAQAEPVAVAPAAPVTALEANVLLQRDMVKMQLDCGILGLICAGHPDNLSPHQVLLTIPFLGFLVGDFAICSLGFSVKGSSYTGGLSISAGSSC